jgi:hypothetical protein
LLQAMGEIAIFLGRFHRTKKIQGYVRMSGHAEA